MLRLVLRSENLVGRIRRHLPSLLEALPQLKVVSVNLHPEHKAVLEGDREVVLTAQPTLRMRVNDLDLHLRPQSFFQTHTETPQPLPFPPVLSRSSSSSILRGAASATTCAAGWNPQTVQHLVYSSWNAKSLASDLAAMPSFTARRMRLLDMFPQTSHYEAMVLLERS